MTDVKVARPILALTNISEHEDLQPYQAAIRDAISRHNTAARAREMADAHRAQADAALVENSGKRFADAADEAELKWNRARREERVAEQALETARRNFDEAYARLARTLNDEVFHPLHRQLIDRLVASLQPATDAHTDLVELEEHYEKIMPRGLGLRRLSPLPWRQMFGTGGVLDDLRRQCGPQETRPTAPDTRVWVEFLRDADVTGFGGYTTGDRAPFPPDVAELLTRAIPPDPAMRSPGRKPFAKRVEGPST